jgi:site-specific DNA recombinase
MRNMAKAVNQAMPAPVLASQHAPLRAVVYSRISREEESAGTGVESTEIQARDGRAAVEAKGWTLVAPAFVDQGISGAEFAKRTRLQELFRLAKQGAFDVVVVRDQKRIGRDAARVTHALVELDNVGIRVWCYQERKFAEIGGVDFIVTAANGYAAENERKTNNSNVRRALRERVERGLATGGKHFGYRSVPVDGARPNRNGNVPQRWVIDPEEAAVIVRVGETFVAAGGSCRGAALRLNDAGLRSTTGTTWDHKAIKRIVTSPLYRGRREYGRKRTLYARGTGLRTLAPEDDVFRSDCPELAIWPKGLLKRIDTLLATVSPRRTSPAADMAGKRQRHLASSIVACAVCGQGISVVKSRKGGNAYVCRRHIQHGRHGCIGVGYRSQERVDDTLKRMAASLVTGDVARRALAIVKERINAASKAGSMGSERQRLMRELTDAEQEKSNLARAIAKRGDLDALLAALDEVTSRAASIRDRLSRLDAAPKPMEPRRVIAAIEGKLAKLSENIDARAVLAAALQGRRLVATPVEIKGQRRWQLSAKIGAGYLMALVNSGAHATDGGKTWVPAPVTLQARTTIAGLVPGATVLFRYRPVTKSGEGDWSQAASLVIA